MSVRDLDIAAAPTPAPAQAKRLTVGRAAAAAVRRLRLSAARLRHPRAVIGAGCDIRRGFVLRQGSIGRVELGARCVVDDSMTIEAEGLLRIGARTIFGHHCTLAARESVVIGEDCLIAEMVSIRDHDHRFDRLDVPVREQGTVSSPVVIGRNVWLGAKVTVTRGVHIGDNAIVGANAVVTRDIPANAIAAGIPARVIRFREQS